MHVPRKGEFDRVLRVAFEGGEGCGARPATAELLSEFRNHGTPVAERGSVQSGPQEGGRDDDLAGSPMWDYRTRGPSVDQAEAAGVDLARTSRPEHFGPRLGSLPLEPARAPPG